MNAQQLKNSILQEAIEGRLVPQDPNDEPASVLLERIRKEKAKLVKEGKLKKKDLEETPISKEEIPFEIPKGWEWVRLKTLSKAIHYGYTASSAPSGNAKLLRITDIQDDKVDWSTVPFCTIKEKDLTTYQLQNRDILIARTGGTVGKTYIVRELEEVSVFASYLIRAIPLESIDEEYIKLFMASPCYWSQLTDAATGTGQPNVNGQSLSNLILPLPPLAEQKRIVAKIEELLPEVEEYGKAQEALDKLNAELPERLKKSILQEAIEGRLVPQDPNEEPASVLLEKIRKEKKRLVKEGKLKKKDLEEIPISKEEIPFEIPESWEWTRIGDHISATSGLAYKKDDLSIFSKEYIRVLRGGNISFGSWSKKDDDVCIGKQFVSEDLILKRGTFISPAVTSLEHMGKTALIRENQKDVVAGGFVLMLHPHYTNEQYWEYLNYFFQTGYYREKCQSITNKSGQAFFNISRAKLLELLIPLPPLQEQHRIVAKIEQLINEIDKLKE